MGPRAPYSGINAGESFTVKGADIVNSSSLLQLDSSTMSIPSRCFRHKKNIHLVKKSLIK